MIPERVIEWTVRFTRRYWVTLLLVATIVSVVVYSLDAAGWVSDDAPLTASFLLGIAFGWMLATSCFSGAFALFYAIFIAILAPIQGVGKIIPPAGKFFAALVQGDLVNDMNLHVVEFSLRVTGWVETLRAGENIRDTGLFVLLLGMILVLVAVWLMWAIIRQRRALNGLLPVALLLAINIHLSRQSLANYVVFLIAGLLLVVRTSFNSQHEDWERRRVDYPEQLGLEWGGSAMALVLVIVLLARLAPFVGTSEGWQAISDWVTRYRQQTSDTATRLFSGVKPPPPPPNQKPEVYVNTPNMGEIGAPITQGSLTIMWVTTSDPAPVTIPANIAKNIPGLAVRTHYWRNGIYGIYTGRGWEPAPNTGSTGAQTVLPTEPPVGRYYLRQTFDLEAHHSGTLFSVNNPVEADQGAQLRQLQASDSQLLLGQASKYQVISEATDVTANELADAPVDYPPDIRATYLQLPGTVPDRLRILANRLVTGDRDPYHKAVHIQNYLRENFKYDLSVKEAPAKRDVVDYFVFDTQAGFCSHFASAMTVLLREVGVPARVATGYATGEYNPERAAYRVPESASHAWVEVYFPGYGWVEFEPTVARAPIEYVESGPRTRATLPATDQNVKPKAETKPYLIGLVLAVALALLVMPFLLLRMFSTTRQAPVIQVDVLYRRMRRVLAWAGMTAVPSMTPDEYLAFYSGQLAPYERLSQALHQVTSLYRETTYSPRPPDEVRVRRASTIWQQSISEWLKLWLKVFWKKVKQ